jgi:hypothetical protein
MAGKYMPLYISIHTTLGCSVTHEVHLMWVHVAKQMGIPGRLSKKNGCVGKEHTPVGQSETGILWGKTKHKYKPKLKLLQLTVKLIQM